jgi:NAD+ kinase
VSPPRVIVVVKRTHYGRHVEEENDPEIMRLIRRGDPSVANWVKSHEEHAATLKLVQRALKDLGARVWVVHGPRVAFDASDAALVVTVGGDGTLLAASHHIGVTPILGVNSSPRSSVGFFCAGRRSNARALLESALAGEAPGVRLARMQVVLNGRVISRRVLNEALFCHETPAAASRYLLKYGARQEQQVSSGFWIGTAAGSTGALRSAGGKLLALSSKSLQLVVREPFVGGGARYRMTSVVVASHRELLVTSKMHDACLFLDGPFKKTSIRLGDRLAFSTSAEPICVLGLTARRGRVR